MGIDITAYRARIGRYVSSKCLNTSSLHQKRSYMEMIYTSLFSQCVGRLGAISVTFMLSTVLCLAIIVMLLILGGVEQNPGPHSKKTKNKASRASRSRESRESQSSDKNESLDDSQAASEMAKGSDFDVVSEVSMATSSCKDLPLSRQSSEETNPKTLVDSDTSSCQGIRSLDVTTHGEVPPSIPSQTRSIELPLVQMVSQQSEYGADIDRFDRSKAVVQDVFNTAHIQNTAVNINIDLSGSTGPVQFGQSNIVTGDNMEAGRSECEEEKGEKMNPLERHLRDTATAMIQEHSEKIFVHRKAVDKVISKLKNHGMAFITGIPGEGKTSVALEVMRQVSDGSIQSLKKRVPIKIDEVNDWKSIITKDSSYIVLIDDVFGHVNFNQMYFDKWAPKFDVIRMFVDTGNIYVIITLRKGIFYQAQKQFLGTTKQGIFANKYKVDLSTNLSLTFEEKFSVLEKYISQNPDSWDIVSRLDTVDILEEKTTLGFPYLCYMFFTNDKFLLKGIDFFRRANILLVEQIDNFYQTENQTEKKKYVTLVYTWLNDKSHTLDLKHVDPFVSAKSAETVQKMRLLHDVARACGLYGNYVLEQVVRESAQCLIGSYLVYCSGVYKFPHTSVMEAVCLSFGKLFPDMVLYNCDDDFIMDFITTEDEILTEDEMKVYVEERYFHILAERVHTIMQKNFYILNSKIMRDRKFMLYFVKSKDRTADELTVVVDKAYYSGNHDLIQSLYEHGATCSKEVILQIARSSIVKKRLLHMILKNRTAAEMTEALFWACQKGNKPVAKFILQNEDNLDLGTLTRAECVGKSYYEMLKFLTENGALWSENELSTIMKSLLKLELLDKIKYFHIHGAILHFEEIQSVLRKAITVGCLGIVKYFCKPEYIASDTVLPADIQNAIEKKFVKTVSYLHSVGIVLTTDQIETTANLALDLQCFDAVKYFHEKCKLYSNEQLQSAFDEAISEGLRNVVEYFQQNTSVIFTEKSLRCLLDAFRKGHIDMLKYFHNRGITLSDQQMAGTVHALSCKVFRPVMQYCINEQFPITLSRLLESVSRENEQKTLRILQNSTYFWRTYENMTIDKEILLSKANFLLADYLFQFELGTEKTLLKKEKLLEFAFRKKRFGILKSMLENGTEIGRDKIKEAFKYACEKGIFDLVEFLHERYKFGMTPKVKCDILKMASERGNIQFLKYFHENISKLTAKQQVKILQTACVKGYKKVLSFINKKLSPLTSEQMKLVLDTASRTGKTELIKFLEYNNVPISSEYMSNTVDAICTRRKIHMLLQLHEKGVEITPSQYRAALITACKRGSLEIVEYLHEKVKPLTPCHLQVAINIASEKGKLSLIRYLHANGALMTKSQLEDASQAACAAKNLKTIIYLCENGASFSLAQITDAFFEACALGKLYMVKYFHQSGAIMSATDSKKIINNAIDKDFLHILVYFFETDEPFTHQQVYKSLILACKHGSLNTIKGFYETESEFSKEEMTEAINAALERRHFQIIKYLHDKGAQIASKVKQHVVDFEVKYRLTHLEILKFLHEDGAKFTLDQMKKITISAIKRGKLEVVKYFIQHGTILETSDVSNIFQRVLGKHHYEVIYYLDKLGLISIHEKMKSLTDSGIDRNDHCSCDAGSLKCLHKIDTPFTTCQITRAAVFACESSAVDTLKYFCDNDTCMSYDIVSKSVKDILNQEYALTLHLLQRNNVITEEQRANVRSLGYTGQQVICENNRLENLKYLHEIGITFPPMQLKQITCYACIKGDIDTVQYFHGMGVKLTPTTILLAMDTATQTQNVPMCKFLVEKGLLFPSLLVIFRIAHLAKCQNMVQFLSLKTFVWVLQALRSRVDK